MLEKISHRQLFAIAAFGLSASLTLTNYQNAKFGKLLFVVSVSIGLWAFWRSRMEPSSNSEGVSLHSENNSQIEIGKIKTPWPLEKNFAHATNNSKIKIGSLKYTAGEQSEQDGELPPASRSGE
jgi:hypothetical protein